MKTLVSILFILSFTLVHGQKKKDLISELNKHRYGVVMNSTYDVKQIVLEKVIEEFLNNYGYVKSKNPDDVFVYRVSHGGGYGISDNPPKDQAPREEKGVKTEAVEPIVKSKKQKYKSVYYTIIRELILDVEGMETLSVKLNKNSFPTPGKDNKIHRGYFTINQIFYELKKHLYIQYHEGVVKLPEDLVSRVNTFNSNKKSNRNKIDLHKF